MSLPDGWRVVRRIIWAEEGWFGVLAICHYLWGASFFTSCESSHSSHSPALLLLCFQSTLGSDHHTIVQAAVWVLYTITLRAAAFCTDRQSDLDEITTWVEFLLSSSFLKGRSLSCQLVKFKAYKNLLILFVRQFFFFLPSFLPPSLPSFLLRGMFLEMKTWITTLHFWLALLVARSYFHINLSW